MATPSKDNPSDKPIVVDGGEAMVDRENAFMLYASFCGDLARTAHALNISPTTVLRVADEEDWAQKLAPILELKKGTKPGDIERAMNRAVNFVQAHRMRLFVSKAMDHLASLTGQEFDDMMFPVTVDKNGRQSRHFTTRPFADLATAMEKAQALSYSALNDTAPERIKRKDNAVGDTNINEMHAKLAQAMAEVGASKTPRALLFDAQLAEADAARPPRAPVVENPHDNDDH